MMEYSNGTRPQHRAAGILGWKLLPKKNTMPGQDHHVGPRPPFFSFSCPGLAADLEPQPRLQVKAGEVSPGPDPQSPGDPRLRWSRVRFILWLIHSMVFPSLNPPRNSTGLTPLTQGLQEQ
eukprot:g18068.t1